MSGAVRDCRTARVIERCTVHDVKEVAREAIDHQKGSRVSGAREGRQWSNRAGWSGGPGGEDGGSASPRAGCLKCLLRVSVWPWYAEPIDSP